MTDNGITIAAKCAPDGTILSAIQSAGLSAVELFLNSHWLTRLPEIIPLCRDFQFRYAVHAPTDTFQPDALAEFSAAIGAEIVVFHDIFWDEEWDITLHSFAGSQAKLCMENVASIHGPIKFMRRYNMGCCLDLEHLQLEIGGVFDEEFLRVMKTASHVHMSGYSFGSGMWHTHIHHSPEHCTHLLNLLEDAGYTGMIVSEARVRYQTREEFAGLSSFVSKWECGRARGSESPRNRDDCT
jgi:sugar phosphate isomerase/epimerase